ELSLLLVELVLPARHVALQSLLRGFSVGGFVDHAVHVHDTDFGLRTRNGRGQEQSDQSHRHENIRYTSTHVSPPIQKIGGTVIIRNLLEEVSDSEFESNHTLAR